mgnify:FL=1
MKLSTILFTTFLILSCNQNTQNNNQMGIFDRLFGKKETTKTYSQKIEKTSEMLDETIFWNIVDSSVKNTKNQEAQELFLVNEIEKLTPKQTSLRYV